MRIFNFLFTSFIKLLLVFRVPVTCNHLNTAQTIVCTKDHSASCTCYHLNTVQTIVRTNLLFVYETRNTVANVCRVWSNIALVYRNIWFATIAIDCIQLWQGSRVFA